MFDLDTRQGHRWSTTVGNDRYQWQAPQFMPDGKSILAKRCGTRWPVHPHPRAGRRRRAGRAIGPTRDQDGGGATAYIAPDGKTVFAVYHDNGVDDHKIWSIDVATGVGHELRLVGPASS